MIDKSRKDANNLLVEAKKKRDIKHECTAQNRAEIPKKVPNRNTEDYDGKYDQHNRPMLEDSCGDQFKTAREHEKWIQQFLDESKRIKVIAINKEKEKEKQTDRQYKGHVLPVYSRNSRKFSRHRKRI